ncbi:hypothetical protein E3P92_04147 [Wallemia ichthyophaga]|uniref:Uncharacterized protein n=1 Tax=Wallemia ichthyophaga TaxID=245174 RepID=A0A4T0L973_WALIC|nr:hypothetical protein E3P93_04132 [Wallemia ichthyophaga]TIB07080.1 hypothetical protein E3P92_04147 [Wallemia ichthyophaga]TIB07262.1 hypothetical protein E3P90_04128 [Wallemia ichthyophaga]TIB19263.1 hypothetical protein E3P89_04125 [Wallemia ichthyophaga]TIB19745.1 hypothetical protein E3P88_04133 [Wallemia ichthyophaga]
MKSLWQLGRQLKLARPVKSLKGLVNPFKAAAAAAVRTQALPRAAHSSTRLSSRTIHRNSFHTLGHLCVTRSATRPAFGNFASRTPQAGLGCARTYATGRGAVDAIQNINVFARCTLNLLGEDHLDSLQASQLRREREDDHLTNMKSYFDVPACKTVLVAPLSSSLSHLLTETKPLHTDSASANGVLFDDTFVRDLVSLRVSSNVHAKRLDALCASVQSVADTLEVTSSASGLLIVKATFDGTAKEIGKLIHDKLDRLVLDDIANAHRFSGWYRLYQLDGDTVLHDMVSKSFYLPDPDQTLN